jgi:hypothetical protein
MALFIQKLKKFISKRRPFKGDKKERPRSNRVCYNFGKNGHFIAQCPYEKREEDNEKKKKFDKSYKKDKKFTKMKPYGQAHVGQECNHRLQGQSFMKQVTISKPPQEHMPHGKGKQEEGKIKIFLFQICH